MKKREVNKRRRKTHRKYEEKNFQNEKMKIVMTWEEGKLPTYFDF